MDSSSIIALADLHFSRDLEREPTRRYRHWEPQFVELTRCSVCSKPLLDELPDTTGRCVRCHERDAAGTECDCGYLFADEECGCSDV